MSQRLEILTKRLFELTDSVECSDNNRYFFPTTIQFSSCRVMAGKEIGDILEEMKQIVGSPIRMTEKEMHLLNYPDDCGECLGKGIGCKVCGGTGSTNPDASMICPRCEGTGDTVNHERESNDCPVCKCCGYVKKCECCNGEKTHEFENKFVDCDECNATGLVPQKDW